MNDRVICPYCQHVAAFLASSASIYHGIDYGPVFYCERDQAWVGCHPGTQRPLGRLANAELRKAKIAAHAAFDPIWKARFAIKHAEDSRYSKAMARGGRYKALAAALGIAKDRCHIGMMDVAMCRRVVEICKSGALKKETA